MIKKSKSVSLAKEKILGYYNKEVEVTVNLGRNKTVSFFGKLTGIYPALFTVSPFDKNFIGKTSYSYSEYLCGQVFIKETKKGT
ncbi:MAG: hypothetical protein E7342_01320 [Clostridiales bacterium]|nr:hypothetical protein [Clostridiales bacterium]